MKKIFSVSFEKPRRGFVRFAVLLTVAAMSARGSAELVLAERGKDGAYAIVAAEDAGPSIRYAAEEIQRYVKELTGVELPISSAAKGPAIRLEQTDEYGADGFRLLARPPDLLVRGGAASWASGGAVGARRRAASGVHDAPDELAGCVEWRLRGASAPERRAR